MQSVRSQRKSFVKEVVPTLPLYRSAPALEVRLEEFELFALDRLRGNFPIKKLCNFRFAAQFLSRNFGDIF